MAAQAARESRIDALTSLRFFAALHVVCFHVASTAWSSLPRWAENVRTSGYTAVSLFFVLSGFVLTLHYGGAGPRIDRRRFWLARLARIYPLYAVALVALVAFRLAVRAPVDGGSALVHLALAQSWTPHDVWSWNMPGWSVSTEAFFYLAFPFLVRGLGWARTRRALVVVALSAWAATLLLTAVFDGLRVRGHLATQEWLTLYSFAPASRLFEFVIGIALAQLHRMRATQGGSVIAAAAALAIFAAAAGSTRIPFIWLHHALLPPAFGALIYGLARGGVLARLLAWRPLVLLGEWSYGVYILQIPVLKWLIFTAAVDESRPFSGAFVVEYLLALVTASALLFYALERPIQRAARAWTRPPRAAAAIGRRPRVKPASQAA